MLCDDALQIRRANDTVALRVDKSMASHVTLFVLANPHRELCDSLCLLPPTATIYSEQY
jgi:hypothetical protein